MRLEKKLCGWGGGRAWGQGLGRGFGGKGLGEESMGRKGWGWTLPYVSVLNYSMLYELGPLPKGGKFVFSIGAPFKHLQVLNPLPFAKGLGNKESIVHVMSALLTLIFTKALWSSPSPFKSCPSKACVC